MIACSILEQGFKILALGENSQEFFRLNDIRKGIQKGVRAVCQELDQLAIRVSNVEDVRNVALVSSNHDQAVADSIAKIYEKVGLEGAVSIEDGSGSHREV